MLGKSSKFEWSAQCQHAFEKLKAVLVNAPVLSAPNFDCQFMLAVDASDVAVGAVLLQESYDAIDHPICYFSRKLSKSQKNYATIEKELLALILALQHFDVYVTSSTSPVMVFSYHNPLVFLHKLKDKNQRLLRWSLLLQEYNLDIRHIKGKDNLIADCLSRAQRTWTSLRNIDKHYFIYIYSQTINWKFFVFIKTFFFKGEGVT